MWSLCKQAGGSSSFWGTYFQLVIIGRGYTGSNERGLKQFIHALYFVESEKPGRMMLVEKLVRSAVMSRGLVEHE